MRKLLNFSLPIFVLILLLACSNCKTSPFTNKNAINTKDIKQNWEKQSKSAKIHDGGFYGVNEEDDVIYYQSQDREKYKNYGENPRTSPLVSPISTFSIDVDTGSYSNARRFLQQYGELPPEDSVRIEEFINYFEYDYPIPTDKPFSIYHEIATNPFDKNRLILHIGLQGKNILAENRPDSNLVFLIDVSGSMNSPNKLGLVKSALLLLTDQMTESDKISIVVYAGAAGLILPPTPGNNKSKIKNALKRLTAGGSTAGSAGIKLAYEQAEKAFIKGGINRVLIATDGDFNVGITKFEDLLDLIEEKRKSGIALTALGFGAGNYNDAMMEQIADKGNGNYYYIDNFNEAKKVLVTQLSSTMQIIAKDVKIQIEFNPKYIASYRLIGYENRKLDKKDFDNDKIDAGEIGAGHTVTALYELTLTSSKVADESERYKDENVKIKDSVIKTDTKFANEIAFFRLRYKNPNEEKSNLIEKPILYSDINKDKPSINFLFSSSVAYFGQLLKKSEYASGYSYGDILKVAKKSKGEDTYGYRKEFENLVLFAKSIAK